MTDALADFEHTAFSWEGKERKVFRTGAGPGVVVISEMPGITPEVAEFGRRVAAAGFTAVLPHVFGEPGQEMSLPSVLRSIVPACVSREFSTLAAGRTSPVTVWLRALCRSVHAECGGRGVGVVGMCFTGGFALAMAADDAVMAPVLSQPSLPFALGRRRARATDISAGDLSRVKQRLDAEDLEVLGLRFTCDRAVPAERFEWLREQLGDRFVAVEIDSSPGNPWGLRRSAHSVLTRDLVDDPGHPTRQALDRVLDLFRRKLA